MGTIRSFRELRVYQDLCRLHLAVHEESLRFPKFEMYELGSQVRRSSNSAPAILAEGWGSRHSNVYLEAVSRAKGEVRETRHHLDMARTKGYFDQSRWMAFENDYEKCEKMLECLYERLSKWRGTTRIGGEVHEAHTPYGMEQDDEWNDLLVSSNAIMSVSPSALRASKGDNASPRSELESPQGSGRAPSPSSSSSFHPLPSTRPLPPSTSS